MRERRPGTSIDRGSDDEITLVGDESESDMPSGGIPRGLLERPTPLVERVPSAAPRHGTRAERHDDEVVLVGKERSDQVRDGVVIALLPCSSDGDHEPS